MHVPVQRVLATAKIRQKKAAAELNIAEDAVLVASTGVIGMQLPIQKLESGIEVMAKRTFRYQRGGTSGGVCDHDDRYDLQRSSRYF